MFRVEITTKTNIVGGIIDYEEGLLDHDQTVIFFQSMVDRGIVWHLQGSYGRMAQALIDAGEVIEEGADGGPG